MSDKRPYLQLDVFNYGNEKLCSLYDSENDISGQAYNVMIQSERNGWRELSFSLPDKIQTIDGEEDNFRAQYLQADFRIRAIDDISTEWYIISEQKITHSSFTKSIDVKAGHCSQLLKLKKLDLEFSDEEGNNTGTIGEIASTILEGTGWDLGIVDTFKEKDGVTEKIRSLKASTKTGAFKLMTSLCDLFDAKAIYNSEVYTLLTEEPEDFSNKFSKYYTKDTGNPKHTVYHKLTHATEFSANTFYYKHKTVDILPMNPFSKPDNGVPDVESQGVVELHYGKNISNVSRSLNTDNIVTKLYAYGSYGDKTNGYCSISECNHRRYTFYNVSEDLDGEQFDPNKTYYFTIKDAEGNSVSYQFTMTDAVECDTFIWSDMDPFSKTYIWSCENEKAYRVYVKSDSEAIALSSNQNWSGTEKTEYIKIDKDIPVGSKITIHFSDSSASSITTKEISSSIVQKLYIQPEKTYIEGDDKLMSCNISYGSLDLSADENAEFIFEAQERDEQYEYEEIPNLTSFLLDFDYYQTIGLMSEEQFQTAASYQIRYGEVYNDSVLASSRFIEKQTELREIIGVVDFCKLSVGSIIQTNNDPNAKINLNYIGSGAYKEYEDGIVYHTQYEQKRFKRFKWRVATEFLSDGNPKEESYASMLYILHNVSSNIEIKKIWLKSVNGISVNEEIDYDAQYENIDVWNIGTWNDGSDVSTNDLFYLFGSNMVNGTLGAYEVFEESAQEGIESTTQVVTTKHPVIYSPNAPQTSAVDMPDGGYQWYWRYDPFSGSNSQWFFARKGVSDDKYKLVYYNINGNVEPSSTNTGEYWYKWNEGMVYVYDNGWTRMDSYEDQKIIKYFGAVLFSYLSRDRYRYGMREEYVATISESVASGDYYFKNGYGTDLLFSVPETIYGKTLRYDIKNMYITTDNEDTTYEIEAKRFTTVKYYSENILNNTSYKKTNDENVYETSFFRMYPSTSYTVSKIPTGASFEITYYTSKYVQVGDPENPTTTSPFVSDKDTYYAKLKITVENMSEEILSGKVVIRATNYLTSILVDEKEYKLFPVEFVPQGELDGILSLTTRFSSLADETYSGYLSDMLSAQNTMNELNSELSDSLGDIYREGYWQADDYVDGDEQRLYDDALDNIEEISKPAATYNIGYVHLRDQGYENGLSEDTISTRWPDLSTSMAAHLIDPTIAVNVWAFIDKIQKYYDCPWKTTIAINTNLKTLTQHSFNDVMSNIANVASQVKGNMTKYDAAASSERSFQADKLEGTISAEQIKFDGGKSSWYTDVDGNMIFEAADGSSAMKLTGYGMCVSNSKDDYGNWRWRNFWTGEGGVADEITVGQLSVDVIEAGSITADKLESSVGKALVLSSTEEIKEIVESSDLAAHFDFGLEEDIPYLDIYAQDKNITEIDFKLRLTDKEMKFYWRGKNLATYRNTGLTATAVDAEYSMRVGKLNIVSDSGGIGFKVEK